MKLKEADKGWAAGFFDGEGCIVIFKRQRRYDLRIHIANTNLARLLHLQKFFA